MNRPTRILIGLALTAFSAALASAPAHAQYAPSYGNSNVLNPGYSGPSYSGQNLGNPGYGGQNPGNQGYGNQNQDAGGGGVLPLPKGVRRVIGIDAQNMLLVELEPQVEGGPSEYRAIPVRHVYVGGIAKLFGGSSISTEEFVSPAFSKGGFGQNGGGQNGGGQNGYGFNNGLNTGGNPFNGGNPFGGLIGGGNLGGNGNFVGNGSVSGAFGPGTLGANGYPGGYSNGYPGIGGGFGGSPQVTLGVGNFMLNRQLPIQIQNSTQVR